LFRYAILRNILGVATLRQKIDCERRMRELIEDAELPEPDRVEYGHTCIRLFWEIVKTVIVVDIDPPPEGREDDAFALMDGDIWQPANRVREEDDFGDDVGERNN
jgi:hypothetical protein